MGLEDSSPHGEPSGVGVVDGATATTSGDERRRPRELCVERRRLGLGLGLGLKLSGATDVEGARLYNPDGAACGEEKESTARQGRSGLGLCPSSRRARRERGPGREGAGAERKGGESARDPRARPGAGRDRSLGAGAGSVGVGPRKEGRRKGMTGGAGLSARERGEGRRGLLAGPFRPQAGPAGRAGPRRRGRRGELGRL